MFCGTPRPNWALATKRRPCAACMCHSDTARALHVPWGHMLRYLLLYLLKSCKNSHNSSSRERETGAPPLRRLVTRMCFIVLLPLPPRDTPPTVLPLGCTMQLQKLPSGAPQFPSFDAPYRGRRKTPSFASTNRLRRSTR